MKYLFENGFKRETLEMNNKSSLSYHYGIVEMEDGRVFKESRCYNDNVKPCYEVLTSKEGVCLLYTSPSPRDRG